MRSTRSSAAPPLVHAGTALRLLLTHIAVDRTRIRADVVRLAKASGAGLVVCGHSHVPFAAHDRGLTVFNPGSVGPRRFHLPIVFGVIEVRAEGVSLRHVDCETGLPWTPSTAAARGQQRQGDGPGEEREVDPDAEAQRSEEGMEEACDGGSPTLRGRAPA